MDEIDAGIIYAIIDEHVNEVVVLNSLSDLDKDDLDLNNTTINLLNMINRVYSNSFTKTIIINSKLLKDIIKLVKNDVFLGLILPRSIVGDDKIKELYDLVMPDLDKRKLLGNFTFRILNL